MWTQDGKGEERIPCETQMTSRKIVTPQNSASEELGGICAPGIKICCNCPRCACPQTPDLARPSLKPCFSLYLVSPSPLFEFGPVGFISYSSASKIKPKKSYIFSHNNFQDHRFKSTCTNLENRKEQMQKRTNEQSLNIKMKTL